MTNRKVCEPYLEYNEITESNKIQTAATEQKTKIFTEQLLPELYKFVTYGNVPKVEDIVNSKSYTETIQNAQLSIRQKNS